MPGVKPGGKTLTEDMSNSISDWVRVLSLDDYDNDDGGHDDVAREVLPVDSRGTSFYDVNTSILGSGLRPGNS